MKLFRYRVQPAPDQPDGSHFELRVSDLERPIHIVLRGHNNTIAINHMSDGVWGDEQVTASKVPVAELRVFYLEIMGNAARVFLDGQELSFKMPISHDEATLFGAAKNASFNQYLETKDTPTKPEKKGSVIDWLRGKSIKEVRFIGRTLNLGPDSDMWLANELIISPGLEVNDTYMSFLSTRSLARAGMKLTILDLSSTSVANALKAAILLPDAEVIVASGDSARDRFIGDLVKRNDIRNLKTAPMGTMAQHFRGTSGAILVQGSGVFAAFGADIDKMTAEQRANLSIFSHEPTPVRADRVFPCANAFIMAGPRWRLNFNRGHHPDARRHGLDVTVAAYNAKEHLIECATSLLCEGRDDVRVIIVDDGSTDGSGEMAARHFKRDPRVRVERKPNGGCASARNYGRLVSDATHIAFVDADDFVTPDFFADLYDLALYSGCEVTQGGFDFHDIERKEPFYPSYEENSFKDYKRERFMDQPVIHLHAQDIIKGQPTIWRKVYRRDFLDAKNIYFPENIRSYDDYVFQLLTLTAARDILMMPEHLYHYRQHPGQDIKQGDERHFYMMQMFRTLLRRSIEEGWPNFRPYAQSIIDSINWSSTVVRPDLVDSFLIASARIVVAIHKVYGDEVVNPRLLDGVKHSDFMYHYTKELKLVERLPNGPHWAYTSGAFEHPDTIRMRSALPSGM